MTDLYSGDPKIFIDENGARLDFRGGQPVMDQGLENAAIISLHTRPGWWGNILARNESEQIGSDFEVEAKKPITLENINNIRAAAEEAEAWLVGDGIASSIQVEVNNPIGNRIETQIAIFPPGDRTPEIISTQKNGANWINQAIDPAYRKE